MTSALLPPPQDEEEARLLAAIQTTPDDDGLRLVYADHLLRRGDPRGELYAIQATLERGVGPWRRYELEELASTREDHEAITQRFGAALYHPRHFAP